MTDLLPVLWLTGPPGVGKTTVAREVWRRLRDRGSNAGYISIDQLGMFHPAPADDPRMHALKAANLAAVVPGFAAAGAHCLVMCGVADPDRITDQAARVPGARIVLGRLRSPDEELRPRLVARGWRDDLIDAALAEAEALDRAGVGEFVVDTGGLSVSEVADRVMAHCGDWRYAAGSAATRPSSAAGSILWLCGTTGVGKSTVAWDVFTTLRRRGRAAALVDLDQIGCLPDGRDTDPGNHTLKARNLAAIWRVYHGRGARHLVINGPLDTPATEPRYVAESPDAEFTVVRLDASRETLLDRLRCRARGESWRIPGDELLGLGFDELESIADRAMADAARADIEAVGHVVLDTDGRAGADVARDAMEAADW